MVLVLSDTLAILISAAQPPNLMFQLVFQIQNELYSVTSACLEEHIVLLDRYHRRHGGPVCSGRKEKAHHHSRLAGWAEQGKGWTKRGKAGMYAGGGRG